MDRYRLRDDGDAALSARMVVPKQSSSRLRKQRDMNLNALQELDETVASIGSHRGGGGAASWNDGDSVSQSSQSIATHEGHTIAHRSLIANMRDIKDMRGRSLPNPYVVGPRSVSSRRSIGSRASRASRRSSRKRGALERIVSMTLLETATSEDGGESHFLSMHEEASFSSVVTTEDILNDLVTVSTIVEHETKYSRENTSSSSSSASSSSHSGHVPKNPKSLLPNTSGDSGEGSYDAVDYVAPGPASTPIFFKLQKQAHQTIPEEESTVQHDDRHYVSPPTSPSRSQGSPTDPFSHLDTRESHSSSLWSSVERPQHPSPGPSPLRKEPRRTNGPMDPPAVEPKQLFQSTPAEDGFHSAPTDDTPIGASVKSFFQSQLDNHSEFPSDWNAEWTTFETSPFEASDASPSSVVDTFKKSIAHTASVDSGYGSKYSI